MNSDRTIRQAVKDVVERQVAIGIDIVSDGETSKISYASYVKDRLTGFGGDSTPKIHLDLRDHPEFRRKMALVTGQQRFRRMPCIGPSTTSPRSRR